MSTVFVTFTDTVTDDAATPSTFSTRIFITSFPTTTKVESTQTTPSTSLSSTVTTCTAEPTISFPKPTEATSQKGSENSIIIALVTFLILAVTGLAAVVFFIWRYWKGKCPGCAERDKRIRSLQGDALPVPKPGQSAREFPVYEGGTRKGHTKSFGRQSNMTLWPIVESSIPPTDNLLPPPVPRVLTPSSRYSRPEYLPPQAKREPTCESPGSFSNPNFAATASKLAVAQEDEHRNPFEDAEVNMNTIYQYPNGYLNPYANSSPSSESPYARPDEPSNYDPTVAEEMNNGLNPYRYQGLKTPSSERKARPPSKAQEAPKISERDLVNEELARADMVRNHRRTGGYGEFSSIELSSPEVSKGK